MNLKTYQSLTSRTNTDLGSKAINAAHVTLGIVGEWEEMTEAIGIDFYKEAGDVMWYISELANEFDIELKPINGSVSENSSIGWIAENVKKYLAYKKDIDVSLLTLHLNNLVYLIKEVDEEEFETILSENIQKLQKRFPDKFSPEDAMAKKDEL